MTETAHPAPTPAGIPHEWRVVFLVCAAHFVSHYYILLLPPLFEIVRSDYGVSYTEIGFALTAFGTVSALLQTPTGFLVDRIGARALLIAGLLVGSTAFFFAGLIHSFWVFVAMFALAGVGNTVYHPANYALLSHEVSGPRVGTAFSAHNFSGMFGSAVAPTILLLLYGALGWRGAFMASALLGFVAAAVLALGPGMSDRAPVAAADLPADIDTAPAPAPIGGLRLLMTPAILLNWVFFALISFTNMGLQTYASVAAQALFGTPLTVGNTAMTAYLAAMAVGTLFGGVIAAKVKRHALVAMLSFAITGAGAVLMGVVDIGAIGLIAAMAGCGVATGCAMPSRDMLVRDVTPPGSFGKVFGFVSTGFNFSGAIGPMIYGLAMDHGQPRAVFLLTAAACLIGIAAVASNGRRGT